MQFKVKDIVMITFSLLLLSSSIYFASPYYKPKYETPFKVGDCVLASRYGKWEVIGRGFKLVEKDGYLFKTGAPLVANYEWYIIPPATISAEELERYYRTVTCP